MIRNHSDNSQIERTKRIIKIWEDRDVVTKSCITNLYSILGIIKTLTNHTVPYNFQFYAYFITLTYYCNSDSDQSSKVSVPVEEFKVNLIYTYMNSSIV